MTVHVVLLRGINLGPHRRVAMADLRALLADAGYGDVRTYVQSGNVILTSPATPGDLERDVARVVSERFGFDVPVIARSAGQLARVVELDPLAGAVEDPKRYQVSFLSAALDPEVVSRLERLAQPPERFLAHGQELYCWHPNGVARSKLWNALAAPGLGVTATARNWTTVTTLLVMARQKPGVI